MAGVDEDAGPVVVGVAQASGRAADRLDLDVGGLGSCVACAGVEEREDLVLPGVDGGGEPRDLVDLDRDGPLVEFGRWAVSRSGAW